MLDAIPIPGLFVTGTDTGVGKTLIAGAIARHFSDSGLRVAVCKPCATGCTHQREGLISEDAEFLAHCARTSHPLHLVCPQRYAEPLAPAVAAERAKEELDWQAINRSLAIMCHDADVIIVEGVGGVLVPMDRTHTVLDMIAWLALPAVIVSRPALGTINHTLLSALALRSRDIEIAGAVINRYPAQSATIAEETNPRAIERWGKLPVLCIVPEVKDPTSATLPPDVTSAIATVDWLALTFKPRHPPM